MAVVGETLRVPPDTTQKQARVADPRANAWVSANAGSGKTYVLSRRVLRLLLDGAAPEAILCLTYTKAAAAEMRHRVTGILARWAREDESTLVGELSALLERRPDGEDLLRARALFARALDTPGGLKINTIHAFCEAVLQRFPREAGVPVDFGVIEEDTRARLLADAREAVLAEGLNAPGAVGEAVRSLFDALSDHQIEVAIGQCLLNARKLGPILEAPDGAIAALRASLGLAEADTLEALERAVIEGMIVPVSDWPAIFAITPPKGGKKRFEDKLAGIDPGNLTAHALFDAYLKGDGTVPDKFPKVVFDKRDAALADRLRAEAERLAGLFERRKGLVIAHNSAALTRVLGAIVLRYETQKRARSLMDFDDLVARTAKLLSDRALGPWVRYKLDAGIDHILVDESQDTNPEQWAVIEALVEDYFAGDVGRPKTVFAVGDPKQSIYSFQGAEPALFIDKGRALERRAGAAGQRWHSETLRTSFRTLGDILEGVDQVFARPDIAAGVLSEPGAVRHESARTLKGGRIEIWPVVEAPEAPQMGAEWPTAPIEGLASAPRQLANTIAETIAGWIALKAPLGPRGRAIRAEDILILVQKRQGVFGEIVRALKQRNISSPGADRLPVSAHIAIDDLLGLADVLLNPRDDLMLAAVLRSPLFEISEDELYALAHGRGRGVTLWERLGASEMAPARSAHARLVSLRKRLDFDRPYEFFAHVLYAQQGLKQFHGRLGDEVDEVIAEFLDLALEHETSDQPSLTGFLAAMRASDIVIKRDLASTAAGVRVMTVHGAKGLEAPIVILADAATKPKSPDDKVFFGTHRDQPFLLYCPKKEAHSAKSMPLRAQIEARGRAEYWRNLYVAMTRAEDRLYVAGVKVEHTQMDDTWHGAILGALGQQADVARNGLGEPTAWRYPAGVVERSAQGELDFDERSSSRPLILGPVHRRPVVEVITPSRHDGAKAPREGLETIAEALLDAQSAKARGVALHALLQHLSGVPQDLRDEVALIAAQTLMPDSPDLAAPVAEQAMAILTDPDLSHLFGASSRAEVPFSLAAHRDGKPVRLEGRIDRLVVDGNQVMIVDYKSDAAVPIDPEAIAPAYVEQIALYRLAMERVFPGAVINAAILWTANRRFMVVPPERLEDAARDVTVP